MKILTKEKWYLFKDDGKLFESLVEELLHAKYPDADFKHTSWTRDGGKDFEGGFPFFDGKTKAWAECKYHKDSLPIKDVSMTLFMAYIESAHAILFFSYSPINDEFQKYIDLYQNKSEKIIKIYDDLALEELILKNKDKINFKNFFGDFTTNELVESNGITFKYWVHGKNQSRSLHINELVRLEFCAANHSSKEKKIQLKMCHSKRSKSFQIINSTINISDKYEELSIPPNGIAGISIDLKLSEFNDNLKYPFIYVKDENSENKLQIQNKVECLWLAETPLLGEKTKLFVDKIPSFLNTEYGSFGMLIGGSGTGKSRIVNEITAIATGLNYKKIIFDADVLSHLSAESFFKELIAEIENIPELSHITAEKVKKRYISEKGNSDYTSFALKLLFDTGLQFSDLKDELADYLLYSLSREKYYIALDNIQFYDENILSVFQILIERHDKLMSSFILLSANTDYIYEDTLCDKITNQMELMESKFHHQFIFKRTESFSAPEAFDYLQKCLNNVNDSDNEIFEYEQTLNKIIEVYGTNPLFLQNYIIYLYQEAVIKQTDYSSYYIEDIDKLQESFVKIPPQIQSLLALRENRFIKDVVNEELLEKYILFVSYLAFAKWMSYSMISLLVDIPISIINSMEKVGLIKKNDKDEYGFYHQQIEEYYKRKYPYSKMSNDALKKFCTVAQKQINKKAYIECIFLAQYILNEIDDEIWNEIVLKICIDNIDYQKTYNVCIAVSNFLDNSSFVGLPDKYIEIYTHMTNLLTDRTGIFYAQELYKSVYDRFCLTPLAFSFHLVDLVDMMKNYVINGLHLNQSQDSLAICKKTISLLQEYFSTCEMIGMLLLNLYESQILIYNELQDLDMAVSISDIVIDMAEQSADISKQVSAWYIRGDIYYSNIYSCRYIEEICACWDKAYRIYEDNDINDGNEYSSTALYLNVHMRETLLNIMQKKYSEAAKCMSSLKKYIGKTKMVFFEIKLRHLYVCFEIFAQNGHLKLYSEYDKLDSYIKESIDICAVYGSQTLYLDCFHILAILQRLCAKSEYAIDNYQKSYSIFQLLLKKQGNAIHWTHFILDLVIAMRLMNCKDQIPPHIWRVFDSCPDIRDIIKKIHGISKKDLTDYLEDLQYTGPLYYSEQYVNFPKI